MDNKKKGVKGDISPVFEKVKLKGRDNLPVKHKNIKYPQPLKSSGLPNNYFVCLAIGSRGSGKTYSVVKLIKYYEDEGVYDEEGNLHEIRTIIISPTFKSNPIFLSLKSLDDDDIHEEYSDDLLNQIVEQIEEENEQIKKYQEDLKLYKKFIRIKTLKELTPYELLRLHALDFKPPIQPLYTQTRVVHLICDDLVATGAYKATGKSALTNLCIKNRHKGICMYFLAQSSKQVPRICRVNASLLLLYKFNSDEMTEDLYETVSGCLTKEQFKDIYNEATKEKYNFLCVDATKNDIEFRQNFDHKFLIKDS
ncbi:MAG: Poxvirus protein [Bacteroidota bacterium]|jgi:hypothetical protein